MVKFCYDFRQLIGWYKKRGTSMLRTMPATLAATWMRQKSYKKKSSNLHPLAK